MPKFKVKIQEGLNKGKEYSLMSSSEVTVREILEVLVEKYRLDLDLDKVNLFLVLQHRYVDIDSRIDEEKIVDNEIFIIGDENEKTL